MRREAVAFWQVRHEACEFADITPGMGIGHADAAPMLYLAHLGFVDETYDLLDRAKLGPAGFEKIVDRWGIRRSHPQFWQYFHDLSRYIHETEPVEEGVLDMNRYENL